MKKTDKKTADKLAEMRKRYDRAREYWDPIFDECRDDIRFVKVPGNHATEELKRRRKGRHLYEFPKLRGQLMQVVNEQRQSRPSAKVRGVEESDRGLAQIMQGILYNIDSVSNAELARDIAFDAAVHGGFGVYRVTTDYVRQDDFDLDIQVKPIRNPFGAYCDPAASELDRRDALFWFVPESMPEEQFSAEYPNASLTDFYDNPDCGEWRDAGKVTVAEYWYKERSEYEVFALSTGEIVKSTEMTEEQAIALGLQIVRRKSVVGHKVMQCLTNGHEFLTEPVEFPCRFIPIIPVFGNIDFIDGEDVITGAVRFAKDQQRLHNVHRTAMIEAMAKAPKAPFVGPAKAFEGYEHFWQNANAEDYAFLPYNDQAQTPPQRTQQAEVPVALIQAAQIDNEDMKAATGVSDAAMGMRSNESSGAAQRERKMQSATATYNYIDNLIRAIRFETEIKLDMIPRVYDKSRVVRTLGPDGGEKWVQLYREVQDPTTGATVILNDISKGKYDFTVSSGPSYATQRMEAAEMYANMAGQVGAAMPELTALLAYLVVKNTDSPDAEEVDNIIRRTLVNKGLIEPKEGDQPPPQQQPNPKDMASAKKMEAETEGIQIDNFAKAGQIGLEMGQMGMAPPQMNQQSNGLGPTEQPGLAG